MKNRLRIGGVPEHFNLPWRLAVAENAFAPTGLDVQYSEHPEGTGEMTRALRENELDAALVLTEGAVADVLKYDRNRIVKVYVGSPLTWGIHVAASSDIRNVAEIRGKRVAISRYGSGSHLISIVDAARRGWPVDQMSFVVVNDLNGARRALASGNADVFLWERHTTQPLVDNAEFRRVAQRKLPWPAFVVSARRTWLEFGSGRLRSVLDVVARYATNLKRRKSAASLIADTYGIRPSNAAMWLADVRWHGGYRRPTNALRTVTNALLAQNLIDVQSIDVDRIWHPL